MANEVKIKVTVDNDTSAGLASVDASMKALGNSADSAGQQASSALGSVSSASSGLMSNLGMVSAVAVGGAVAMVAAYLSVVPAIGAIAGAAGAATTALVGMASVFGVLNIGLGGVGDALGAYTKQQNKAGGAAGSNAAAQKAAADRIAAASRQLRDAKEAEVQAAKDVNQARQDEIERLEDLDLQLRGQKISQKEAAQALVEAKEKARRADQAGSEWEKTQAHNALERAQLTYDSTTEKLGDLQQEKDKATKNGVEGSDKVQKALEREEKAHQAVLDAQKALSDAQAKSATASGGAAGGINLFAQAMSKLSPNAKALVYALIDINKQFDEVKKRVQQRLFEGWANAVKELSGKWLPALDQILGSTADHLNKMGLEFAKAIGSDTFINNIKKANEGFNGFLDNLTGAGTAGADAFGRIAAAATPVLKVIGDMIERVVTKFDNWIKKADETGQLQSFFETAATMLQDIFDVGGKVFGILGQVVELIWPSGKKDAQSAFDSVKRTLDRISDWLADPGNKKQIDSVIASFEMLAKGIQDLWPLIKFLGLLAVASFTSFAVAVYGLTRAFQWLGNTASSVWGWISRSAQSTFNYLGRMGSWLSNALRGAWDGLKEGFRSAINWVIARWNGLSFTAPSWMGGGTIGVPQVAYRAAGGIAGGLTMVNERGGEIINLPNGSKVIPAGQSQQMMNAMNGGGGQPIILAPSGGSDDLLDAIWTALAGRIRARGGVVQQALGVPGAR